MDGDESVGIGSDFLGYRIEELIGRGGMGVVYRAYDLRLKRPVALKLVAPALAQDERFRERFMRESDLVMSLEHPNVVPIYDAGDVDGRVYLVMRLVDGNDLGSLLTAERALEPPRAMAICAQVAAALDAAHARGLVHRDVKPSNVLLDASEHVYLADFGLTRRLGDEDRGAGDGRSVGTPAYLAPEQLEGGPVDGRADVYSLGCVLFECLTGEPVFARGSRLAVAWAHLEEPPPRPSQRRAGLPEAIDAVIGRSLAKEPEQRFATCAALVAAAEHALGLGKTGLSRRRRSLLLAGAAGLSIAVTIGLAVAVLGQHGAQAKAGTTARALPPGGKVVARIRIGRIRLPLHVPTGGPLAVGEGAVWAMSDASGTLMRIDPARNAIVARIKVGVPERVAAGDGAVWLSNPSYNTVTRVDPATNMVTKTIRVGVLPEGIAIAPGAVWVANAGGYANAAGPSVSRIDPATNRVVATIRIGSKGDCCADHTNLIASSRAVWVARPNESSIVRIDPAKNRVVATVSTAVQPCGFLTADATGVWFTAPCESTPQANMVARVDPRTNSVTTSLNEAFPVGIVAAFGTLWVTDSGRNVDQISPHSGRLVARLQVGHDEPGGVAPDELGAGFGSVWVNDNLGSVLRIKPQG
jgi:YVTN family beta-propeller protein